MRRLRFNLFPGIPTPVVVLVLLIPIAIWSIGIWATIARAQERGEEVYRVEDENGATVVYDNNGTLTYERDGTPIARDSDRLDLRQKAEAAKRRAQIDAVLADIRQNPSLDIGTARLEALILLYLEGG